MSAVRPVPCCPFHFLCPYRLVARMSRSQREDPGSSPGTDTTFQIAGFIVCRLQRLPSTTQNNHFMNKNTKSRRAIALRNFHVNKQGSTEFDVPVMRPGGYTLGKQTLRIGFVTPPPNKRQPRPASTAAWTEQAVDVLKVMAADADALLGKPKFEQPARETSTPRPALRSVKPLGKINI